MTFSPSPPEHPVAASVVVCTHHRPALLDLCLESLVGQALPSASHEVLVVDNALQEDARPVVERWRPAFAGHGVALRHVPETNIGVAFARNRGIAEATAPLVCFIDDDEQASPRWLETLLAPFAVFGDGVDIVAGEIEPDFGDNQRPDWLTDELLPIFSCKLGWGAASRFLKAEEWFIEGNCAFRKRLFRGRSFATHLGRRGEELTASEGTIFSVLRAAGARAYFAPEAWVSHRIHGERLKKTWIMRRMFFQGSSDCIAHRHYGSRMQIADFNVNLKKLSELNVESLMAGNLKAVSELYYQLGYSAATNMYDDPFGKPVPEA